MTANTPLPNYELMDTLLFFIRHCDIIITVFFLKGQIQNCVRKSGALVYILSFCLYSFTWINKYRHLRTQQMLVIDWYTHNRMHKPIKFHLKSTDVWNILTESGIPTKLVWLHKTLLNETCILIPIHITLWGISYSELRRPKDTVRGWYWMGNTKSCPMLTFIIE
jgi:hypothetical protein